ncbi:MAG: DUF2330 domain-containing protein, partial [Acidobacteriota bacterium]
VGVALGVQWSGTRAVGLPRFDPRSPLISALSLTLLLRVDAWWPAALAAAVAIGSKFLVRVGGKHVFNPANVGIVLAVLLTDRAWISPGQWGSATLFALLLGGFGLLVVHRAERFDVPLTFLLAWAGVLFGRAAWLGDPWAIPAHQLQSGAVLVFAFFMISDPKTTPDRRLARIVWVIGVALVAGWLRFEHQVRAAPIWALVGCAPCVPLIDRLWPTTRYDWPSRQAFASAHVSRKTRPERSSTMPDLRPASLLAFMLAPLLLLLSATAADAFCGFYVAKADTQLFNRASKVVLVRDGSRTVLTMANDYQGDPKEFAVVVPVPTFLEREQIHAGDRAIIEHLDAYTAPRLVEYHDGDPCQVMLRARMKAPMAVQESAAMMDAGAARAEALGVTIEARYDVGEYDILILSAEESSGLETWLRESGYTIPDGASEVLGSYIKQDMRFFVAKVDLEEQSKLGFTYLRPLQVAYESEKFMLPIRLGTVNADGPQELFVWTLTRTGRVETTNYRTVKLPTDVEVPAFVEDDFGDFYRSMFSRAVEKEKMRTVFLEYAWDMNWCDPCAADPLSTRELEQLGVFWLGGRRPPQEMGRRPTRIPPQAQNVYVTRLHVLYTAETFPEDLHFQSTGDRTNFQGRYVIHRPWTGSPNACPAA